MIYDDKEYVRLRNTVFVVSFIAWVVILIGEVEPRVAYCCLVRGSARSSQMLFALNPATALARGWVLMLVAMMAPMLVPAIYHVRMSSFTQRRALSIALFALGYTAIWMAAGGVLFAVEFLSIWLAPQSYLPAAMAGLVALLWQASPIKQRCLNQCHDHRPLAAFGIAADWDVLRMGLEHGLWCVGSCWAIMLFPMLLPQGHFIAMIMVSALMFCERLDPPKNPSWRWRGLGAAFRVVLAARFFHRALKHEWSRL